MKSPTSCQSGRRLPRHLAIPIFLATAAGAHAVPTVTDSFLTGGSNYAVGTTNLVGQGPAALGFTGNWLEAYGGAQSPDVIASGLSYTAGAHTVAGTGGAVEYPLGGNGRAGRLLSTAFNNSTAGTVYFSVMMQADSTGEGYRGIEMHGGGFDDGANRKLQIVTGEGGVGDSPSNYVVRLFNNSVDGFAGDLGPADTNVNFFIGKITFSTTGGEDGISIWRNPTDLTSEAGSGAADFFKFGFDLQIDRVSLARFNEADGFQADEIRFGTTWRDVTTVIDTTDTDGDGLPDSYEQEIIDFDPLDAVVDLTHVAGPNNAPATTDFDGDGASDAKEFIDQTNATNPDSDGDGLTDGQEDNGGIFFSAGRTGSDPLDSDSDDDGLRDGPEVNTHFTNPNIADTDGDLENDGLEVFQGTDPVSSTSSSANLGLVFVDGTRDAALYSTPVAVQTIETGFGDNGSEWNAAYSYVHGGRLHLLFTGNLESNFNKLEIFIDSRPGGSTTFTSAGNDGANVMDGMKFDTDFAPDYHLIARRGSTKFDLDIANLATQASSVLSDIFGGGDSGSGISGTGPANTMPIRAGYNGSNTAGIGGNAGSPADQAAATAVTTGLELSIDLADLGNPTGPIKVMLLQNNNDHTFLSNQTLAGLPVGTGNLGTPATVDFSTLAGDQFFTVGRGPVHLMSGNTEIRFTAEGLTKGVSYVAQDSTKLDEFMNVNGSEFTATGAVQVITLPVSPGIVPKRFFRVKSLP